MGWRRIDFGSRDRDDHASSRIKSLRSNGRNRYPDENNYQGRIPFHVCSARNVDISNALSMARHLLTVKNVEDASDPSVRKEMKTLATFLGQFRDRYLSGYGWLLA